MRRNVLNGQMRGSQGNADAVVHQDHQSLLIIFADFCLNILRVSREMKFLALDGMLVDRRCDEHIDEPSLPILNSTL